MPQSEKKRKKKRFHVQIDGLIPISNIVEVEIEVEVEIDDKGKEIKNLSQEKKFAEQAFQETIKSPHKCRLVNERFDKKKVLNRTGIVREPWQPQAIIITKE